MLKKWNQSMGNEKSTAYLMVFPTAVIITLLGIVPILYVVWLSLCKVNPVTMETEFAGLQNYTETLSNPGFWQSMGITFYFTIVSIALQLFLGVCVALLLNQDFRGRWLVRTLCILPWAVPTLVNANLWKWMLNTSYGIINKLLIALHIVDEGIFWLGDPKLTLNCVILVDTWRMLPMVTLMLLAALQTVSKSTLEAATMDGAGAVRRVLSVYLPSIKPMLLVVLVLRTIQAFRVFDIIFTMTKGGPDNGTMVISFYTYYEIYNYLNYGKGEAIALLILAAMLILSLIYMQLLKEKD